jgi:hypothetical protein
MNHYVSLSLTNRKSSVHLLALDSPPPHWTKDVYTPQVSTRDLCTVHVRSICATWVGLYKTSPPNTVRTCTAKISSAQSGTSLTTHTVLSHDSVLERHSTAFSTCYTIPDNADGIKLVPWVTSICQGNALRRGTCNLTTTHQHATDMFCVLIFRCCVMLSWQVHVTWNTLYFLPGASHVTTVRNLIFYAVAIQSEIAHDLCRGTGKCLQKPF